jgi:hypothetical protein
MTMRTTDYFICPNGHKGVKRTSENDQPYSKMWESVSLTGMRKGDTAYVCTECEEPMKTTDKP